MIKAILFDFDGTLANSLPVQLEKYVVALKACKIALPDKEIVQSCFGVTLADSCKHLGITNRCKQFSCAYLQASKQLTPTIKLFEDTLPTLSLLHGKYKLGIVTFAHYEYVHKLLSLHGLYKFFDGIVCQEDVKQPKPHPEGVYMLCNKLGVDTSETMIVGDSPSDLQMAQAAGGISVLMHPPEYKRFYDLDELKKGCPKYTIQSLNDLFTIV